MNSSTLVTNSKNKLATICIAILFGWFGAHKFYLGHHKLGILYAAFFWTGIPLLISLIEAMAMLNRTGSVFNKKYNATQIHPGSKDMPDYAFAFVAENIPADEPIIDWSVGRPGNAITLEVILIVTTRQIVLYGKQGSKERIEICTPLSVTSIDRNTTRKSSLIRINSNKASIEFRAFGSAAKSEVQKMHNAIRAAQF